MRKWKRGYEFPPPHVPKTRESEPFLPATRKPTKNCQRFAPSNDAQTSSIGEKSHSRGEWGNDKTETLTFWGELLRGQKDFPDSIVNSYYNLRNSFTVAAGNKGQARCSSPASGRKHLDA